MAAALSVVTGLGVSWYYDYTQSHKSKHKIGSTQKQKKSIQNNDGDDDSDSNADLSSVEMGKQSTLVQLKASQNMSFHSDDDSSQSSDSDLSTVHLKKHRKQKQAEAEIDNNIFSNLSNNLLKVSPIMANVALWAGTVGLNPQIPSIPTIATGLSLAALLPSSSFGGFGQIVSMASLPIWLIGASRTILGRRSNYNNDAIIDKKFEKSFKYSDPRITSVKNPAKQTYGALGIQGFHTFISDIAKETEWKYKRMGFHPWLAHAMAEFTYSKELLKATINEPKLIHFKEMKSDLTGQNFKLPWSMPAFTNLAGWAGLSIVGLASVIRLFEYYNHQEEEKQNVLNQQIKDLQDIFHKTEDTEKTKQNLSTTNVSNFTNRLGNSLLAVASLTGAASYYLFAKDIKQNPLGLRKEWSMEGFANRGRSFNIGKTATLLGISAATQGIFAVLSMLSNLSTGSSKTTNALQTVTNLASISQTAALGYGIANGAFGVTALIRKSMWLGNAGYNADPVSSLEEKIKRDMIK